MLPQGWSTLGDEKLKQAQWMGVMADWKQAKGMSAASTWDRAGAEKLIAEAKGGYQFHGFADPTTPVAPWAQHNYAGPAANLAEAFGVNAQASAIRGQAANAAAQYEYDASQGLIPPEWKPGFTGALRGISNAHLYNNGIDMGRQTQAPYEGLSKFSTERNQRLDAHTNEGLSGNEYSEPEISTEGLPPPGSYNPVNEELLKRYPEFAKTGRLGSAEQIADWRSWMKNYQNFIPDRSRVEDGAYSEAPQLDQAAIDALEQAHLDAARQINLDPRKGFTSAPTIPRGMFNSSNSPRHGTRTGRLPPLNTTRYL